MQKWKHDQAFGLEFLEITGEVEDASGVDAQKWVLSLNGFARMEIK